jgi:uncharacterized protein (DUF427 family)
MAKAMFNGIIIAESDDTVMVEGNHYFPPDSVKREFFADNAKKTTCPWKGTANYYDISVNDQTAKGAAWYYPTPKDAASEIKDHVAFYGHQVTITE